LNGHGTEHDSQTKIFAMQVTQAGECVVEIHVLPSSDSGEHKVKIMGVVVAEQPGANMVSFFKTLKGT
jgi:hypothetical protein